MREIECLQKSLTGPSGVSITSASVYSFPTHSHVYYEMTLYQPFDGLVTVNQREVDMRRPALILITPSDFHRIQAPENCRAQFIKAEFGEEILLPAVRARLRFPLILQPVEAGSLPWQLYQELFLRRAEPEDAAILINTLTMKLYHDGEPAGQRPEERIHTAVLPAVRWINAHFTEQITLHEAAVRFSLSPQYLSSVFSRTMGMTFSAYLTNLRLRRAAEWIQESDESITNICFACGYRNLSHFIRSFKKQYGVSPLKYKQRPPQGGNRFFQGKK